MSITRKIPPIRDRQASPVSVLYNMLWFGQITWVRFHVTDPLGRNKIWAPNGRYGYLSERGGRHFCEGETREHAQMTSGEKNSNSEPPQLPLEGNRKYSAPWKEIEKSSSERLCRLMSCIILPLQLNRIRTVGCESIWKGEPPKRPLWEIDCADWCICIILRSFSSFEKD